MHHAVGAYDVPPKEVPNGLVSEADAEDRLAAGKGPDDVEGNARLTGRTGTGREHDPLGIQRQGLLRRDLIIPENALLHAQLTEVLDEVVGERIVVIDDQ